MTESPFQDAVAIDTNVFEHLFDPQENTDLHITQLLTFLQELGAALIVDKGKRISNEYNHRIGTRIANQYDTRNEIYILRYWMEFAPRQEIEVFGADNLMTGIRNVIIEIAEAVDRIFVYVAFRHGKPLISNDKVHIVDGPVTKRGRGPRRHRLLSETKRWRLTHPDDSDILTSREAYGKI